MKKVFLLIFLVVNSINARAQLGQMFSPVASAKKIPVCDQCGDTWAVKAKVLPWMLIGSGINYTLGVEYGFKKVHSIGIDLVYNDMSTEHEVYDTGKKDYVSGPRMYAVVRGAFLNYRRYFDVTKTALGRPMNKVFGTNYLPYLGAFARYGKTDYHYEPGYVTSQVSYDEWQYSGGVLVGIVHSIFDFNIGPFYKQKYITDVEMENGIKVYHDSKVSNWGLRIGVNMFFVLKQRGNHYLAKYAADM